jgi:hypothetical protein
MNKQRVNPSYDQDFYAWAMHNAELLRRGKFSEIDAENIAEELESMGKRDKRQLINRSVVLLIHLLKWEFQPEKRSRSWKSSIVEQRRRILQLLEDSPSLDQELDTKLDYVYREAIKQVIIETGMKTTLFPQKCPYSKEQILSDVFYPETKKEP